LYQIAALPVAIALATASTGVRRVLWLIAGAVVFAAVLASQSRGAVVTTTLVLPWLIGRYALTRRRDSRRGLWIGVLTFAGIAASLRWALTSLPRFDPQKVQEGRGSGRLDIWHVAWMAWQDSPLLGLGAGNFFAQSGRLLSTSPGVQLDPNSDLIITGIVLHNAYLELLVDLGPVGFVLYLVLLAVAFAPLQQRRLAPIPDILTACLPMLVMFTVATMFLSVLNNKLLWMLIGVSAVLPYLSERQAQRPAVLDSTAAVS
jgi:O-antigen ligase